MPPLPRSTFGFSACECAFHGRHSICSSVVLRSKQLSCFRLLCWQALKKLGQQKHDEVKEEQCSEHDSPLRYVCRTCNTCICADCAMFSPTVRGFVFGSQVTMFCCSCVVQMQHTGHKFEKLQAVYSQQAEVLQKELGFVLFWLELPLEVLLPHRVA